MYLGEESPSQSLLGDPWSWNEKKHEQGRGQVIWGLVSKEAPYVLHEFKSTLQRKINLIINHEAADYSGYV